MLVSYASGNYRLGDRLENITTWVLNAEEVFGYYGIRVVIGCGVVMILVLILGTFIGG